MSALLSLWLAHAVRASQGCPSYSCVEPGYSLGLYYDQEVCMELVDTDKYWLTICNNFGDGINCVVSNSTHRPSVCGELPIPRVDSRYPGEHCHSDHDCIGKTAKCVNKVCVGLAAGENCALDYECGLGLFCNVSSNANGTCAFQLRQGDDCTRDEECLNNLGCTGMTTDIYEIAGTCQPYFSLPLGSSISNCVSSDGEMLSKLCESGTCGLNTSTNYVCMPAFLNVGALPVACAKDSYCIGVAALTDAESVIARKSCACGKNPTGASYCPVFSGDQPSLTLQRHYLSLLQSDMSECHTSRRFSDFCFERYLSRKEFKEYQRDSKLAADYPSFIDNDNCVKVNLFSDFYEISRVDGCPAYSCGQLADSQCVAYNEGNSTNLLRMCGESETCILDFSLYYNMTCWKTYPPVFYQYPGDNCTANNQCISSNCMDGVCIGLSAGAVCNDTSACDVGLTCIGSLCSALTPAGGSCTTDTDCVLTAGCNFTFQVTTTGKCVPYFSIATGSPVYCQASGLQPLCSSGWCQETIGAHIGTCIATPRSAGGLPVVCEEDSQCIDTTATFTTKCVCGYNPFGIRYCELFPGDLPYANYLSAVSNLLSNSNSVGTACQTTRRFQADCVVNLQRLVDSSDPNWLIRTYYNATLYPLLQGNDACAQAIFTSQYWSIPPAPSHNTTSAGTRLAITAALLLTTA